MSDGTVPAGPRNELRSKLKSLLNCESAENGSNTPDHILADYLMASLDAFDEATAARDNWYCLFLVHAMNAQDANVTAKDATEIRPHYAKVQQETGNRFAITCDEGWRVSIVCTGMYEGAADWLLGGLGRQQFAPGKTR